MDRRRREQRAGDRGVVSVLSVFFVLLLLTFLAVSINLGRLMRTRGDLQHATDSATLAATESLDVKPSGGPDPGRASADFDSSSTLSTQGMAVQYAQTFTMMNSFGQTPQINTDTGVSYGFWHLRPTSENCAFSTGTNCGPGWEPAPINPPTNAFHMFAVNAVAVTARYPLPPYFGAFLGIGATTMTARSTAYGRRTRVPCAIASAVSVCQIMDAGGFLCPGGTMDRTFVAGENNEPNGLGRVDLVDQWDPFDNSAAVQFMRNYVRKKNYEHCDQDLTYMPAVTEYLSGDGRMPNEAHANLQPVVDSLVGIRDPDGAQDPGRCMLGKTFVVPVVQPVGIETPADCANVCPAGVMSGCIEWPASGFQRVVGFVNVTFTAVDCIHGSAFTGPGPPTQPQLIQANCESQTDPDTGGAELLANNCGGDVFSTNNEKNALRVHAQITCDAPVGPSGLIGTAFQPRLVR